MQLANANMLCYVSLGNHKHHKAQTALKDSWYHFAKVILFINSYSPQLYSTADHKPQMSTVIQQPPDMINDDDEITVTENCYIA